jgi:maltose alpha-D-glucosyltransferase/alpha-amylase
VSSQEPPWYKTAVFYEVAVHSFSDSNDDGFGDIAGLTNKLDYLQWLGITAIWLLPILPSPMRDGGYDVSDLMGVRPEYGTPNDVRTLIDQAHTRGIRVVTDLVVNHTSDQHPWFIEARDPESPKHDWYVWSDDTSRYADARVIFVDTHDSNWSWDEVAGKYYWHRFFDHQPDLNYDNPRVREAIQRAIRFWLTLGFDGLRLDAVPYLFEEEGTNCENLPATHEYLKEVRSMVDAEYPGAVLLAEANQWPNDLLPYFGDDDECHMAFHFPVMPRLFLALATGDVTPIIATMEATPQIPPGAQWAMFLRNHDELTLEMVTDEERAVLYEAYAPDPEMRKNIGIRRRLAPLLGGDRRKIEMLNAVLLSLPGTPVIYYGDEIGMGDNISLPDRDGVRTPMQWTPDESAGWSDADPESFYIPVISGGRYGTPSVNVADEVEDGSSLLHAMRSMIGKRPPEFGTTSFESLDTGDQSVLGYKRGRFSVVANFSPSPRTITLQSIDQIAGPASSDGISVTLPPFGWAWLEVRVEESQETGARRT